MIWWKIFSNLELCIWKLFKTFWIQLKFHSMRILIKTMNRVIWMLKTYKFSVCSNMKDWRSIKRKKYINLMAKTNKKKKKLILVQILISNKAFKIQVIKMVFNKIKIEEGWQYSKMILNQKMWARMVKKKKIRHSTELM